MKQKTKILVVEKNAERLDRHARFLQEEGHIVLRATTGQEALKLAKAKKPDIILLEDHLPDIDGLEVCNRIKSDKELKEAVVTIFPAQPSHPDESAKEAQIRADSEETWRTRIREIICMSDAKKAEREKSYTLSLNNPLDAVVITDTDFNITSWNAIAEDIYGWTEEEVLGRRMSVAVPTKYIKKTREEVLEEFWQHGKWTGVVTQKTKEGEELLVSASVSLITDESGTPISVVAISRDITDYKRVEHALEREKIFKDIAQSIGEWIWELDQAGKFTFVAGKVEQILGYTEDEILGKTPFDFMITSETERSRKIAQRLIKNHEPIVNWENWYTTKSGEKVCLLANGVPIFDEDDNLMGYRGVCKDITQRKKAEEALKKSEEKFRFLAQNSVDVIWQMDIKLKFTYISPSIHPMTGYTQEEWVGTYLYQHASRKEFFKMARQALKAIKNYKTFNYIILETKMFKKNGDEIPVEIIGRLLLDDNGLPVGLQGSTRDITERKKAEEALKKSQANLSKAQRIAHIGSWELLPETQEVSWSDEMYRILGLDPQTEPYTYPEHTQIIHPDDWELVDRAIQAAINQGEGYHITVRLVRPDGSIRYADTRCEVELDDRGNVIRLLGTVQDITERKKAEEKIEFQAKLLSFIGQAVIATDAKGNITYMNAAAEELYGWREEEALGKPILNVTPTPNSQQKAKEIMDALMQGKSWSGEFLVKHRNGTEFFAQVTDTPILDEDGNLIGVIGISQDISDQKAIEEELRKAAAEMRTLIHAIPDIVYFKNRDGRYLIVNRAFEEFFDVTSDEAFGKTDEDILPTNLAGTCLSSDEEAIKTGNTIHSEEYLETENGENVIFETIKTPLSDDKGKVIGIVGISRDITERIQAERKLKRAHDELETRVRERTEDLSRANLQLKKEIKERKLTQVALQKARDVAEAANRAKSEFLANMSHELRTPLNAILGYAQILRKDTNLTERQLDALKTIKHSGDHLLALINEVLDISKIEAGKMELELTEFNFSQFLHGIAKMIQANAEQKGLTFTYTIDDRLPRFVKTDEKKLGEVLLNLLGNAVKYTENGEVIFKVDRKETSDGADERGLSTYRFVIKDTGMGIPADRLDDIFSPFQQIKIQKYRQVDGTGLGLAICQKYIELLGGKIGVESRVEEGSTFHFELTLKEVKGAMTSPESDKEIVGYSGKQRTILIADDKKENRVILADMLSPLDFEIIEAENGKIGLDKAIAHQPDLILLDLMMPEMDGFQLATAIRKRDDLTDMVIIAISASAYKEIEKKSLAAGCDDFIAKPFDVEEILQLVGSHLNLKWNYEETEKKIQLNRETFQALIHDIPERLRTNIIEACKLGNPKKALSYIAELEKSDEKFLPLTDQIRKRLKEFKFNEIISTLNSS